MSNHTHHHNHTHNHVHTNNKKVLTISFIIIGLFMIVEILGGFIANSLALLSDGLHMFSDTVSLGVALIAFIYAEKNATSTKTFGYKRFEVLAALFNGITLLIISGVIIIEAIRRFFNPIKVQSTEMFIISVIGLIVNIIVAIIMFKSGDTSHNLNMRGAFIHVLGDLLGSLGAIIASILIYVFNFTIADPIASILVSIIILKSAIGISRSSLNILMEGTPSDVNLDKIISTIINHNEIYNVHDYHVWTISNDMNALSCHAVVSETMSVQDCEGLLKKIEHELLHLNIQHMTIQLETAQHDHDTSVLCSGLHKEHAHH
ncbi:CDF family zinc efflux transporter CzrB [Staphylococcus hominis]|uniref:CDF family zinc efflux transporter CzrB n=1 Tax=Staphylococcus hominis TaxID=1290 RepID=A0A533IUS7_STAHO|nr:MULTISPECIES: CDF family zinc efflux transporter CzrB [Staphylococcus]AYY66841.1 cation transporter [Staphylococcus hominis]EEK12544.1 cation diffusion facilitator family transporter [Staphylococcus hominis SK119]EFS19653.1 cation efflux family protein [Staphylococcus hominis subsp. hominis C80]EHR89791.1 cadmium, cobalt and zinc/H(+)-K(+) antiporter [Staphylococcus hominis VCU122]MBJ6365507.1 CDF family zinc efflux transporter CzrB [Staphylococcus hominis]